MQEMWVGPATFQGAATCVHALHELGPVAHMPAGRVVVWEWSIMPMGMSCAFSLLSQPSSCTFTVHGSGMQFEGWLRRGWMQTLTCLQGFEVGQYTTWGCADRMREQRGSGVESLEVPKEVPGE